MFAGRRATPSALRRLAHRRQHRTIELRQLVEEGNAVMGKGDLAGTGDGATANETGVGDGMVRGAEGAAGEEGGVGREEPGDGVELGYFEGLGEGEWRQDSGEAAGEHRIALCGQSTRSLL